MNLVSALKERLNGHGDNEETTSLAALSTHDVVTGYGGAPIVDGISLDVADKQITVILGPNGSGKSTLLKSIVRVLPLYSGKVRLHGTNISSLRPHVAAKRGIGYVPQTKNVFASMNIRENLELGLLARGIRPKADHFSFVLDDLFPELADRLSQTAGTLSGGQRQMLAMARVLITQPTVLILDEPTANLSPRVAETVLERMRAIRSQGTPILLVEQRVDLALAISDTAYVLVAGKIRRSGGSREIAEDPDLYRLFLGGHN